MIEIHSKSNEKIKYIKSLLKKKYRDKNKSCIIEGYRIIKDAIIKNIEIECLIIDKNSISNDSIQDIIDKNNLNTYLVDNAIFNEISDTENSQGIIAIIKIKEYKFEDIVNTNNDFILILDRIQDPGNMGTIIRTADSAGVKGIICTKGCVDIYNNKVLRSTMGSIFDMPIMYIENEDVLKIKDNGYNIVSSFLNTDKYYNEIDYPSKVALVIGNEGNGIEESIIRDSDILVKIPIYGKNESLNAGIASGILMYKIREHLNLKIK